MYAMACVTIAPAAVDRMATDKARHIEAGLAPFSNSESEQKVRLTRGGKT